jgi:hypothetical protein
MWIFVEREKKRLVLERDGKCSLVAHFEAVISVGKREKSGWKNQSKHVQADRMGILAR